MTDRPADGGKAPNGAPNKATVRPEAGLLAGKPDPESYDERSESGDEVLRRYLRDRPPHHGD